MANPIHALTRTPSITELKRSYVFSWFSSSLVSNRSLAGRISAWYQSDDWWSVLFNEAISSDRLSDVAKRALIEERGNDVALPNLDIKLGEIAAPPVDARFTESVDVPDDFTPSLFKGFLGSGPTLSGVIAKMYSFIKPDLKLVYYEERLGKIGVLGAKSSTRAQAKKDLKDLSGEIAGDIARLGIGEKLMLKGGCGTSNAFARARLHKLIHTLIAQRGRQWLSTIGGIDDFLRGVSRGRDKLQTLINALDGHFFNEFVGINLTMMLAYQTEEEKRIVDHASGPELKEYLLKVISDYYERSMLQYVESGGAQALDDQIDMGIKAFEDALGDRPEGWRNALIKFCKDGKIQLPNLILNWVANNLFKSATQNLRADLREGLLKALPGEETSKFIATLFKEMETKSIPEAVRFACNELAQDKLDLGFGLYAQIAAQVAEHLPTDIMQQMGLGAPDQPIWYEIQNVWNGYDITVFAKGDEKGIVEKRKYHVDITQELDVQSIIHESLQWRMLPRMDDVAYTLDLVKLRLDDHFGQPESIETLESSMKNAQQMVMLAALGKKPDEDELFGVRFDALKKMHAYIKGDPKRAKHKQVLVEGCERMASMAMRAFEDEKINDVRLLEVLDACHKIRDEAHVIKEKKPSFVLLTPEVREKVIQVLAKMRIAPEYIGILTNTAVAALGEESRIVIEAVISEALGDLKDLQHEIDRKDPLKLIESLQELLLIKAEKAEGLPFLALNAFYYYLNLFWAVTTVLSELTPSFAMEFIWAGFIQFLDFVLPLIASQVTSWFIDTSDIATLLKKLEPRITRTGRLRFDQGEAGLSLLEVFRPKSDIQVDKVGDRVNGITFNSLGLSFVIYDGKAIANRLGAFAIAKNQIANCPFSRYLVLEKEGKKRLVVCEEFTEMTAALGFAQTLAGHRASSSMMRFAQDAIEPMVPHPGDNAYFVYDIENGEVSSKDPSALAYLMFIHHSHGDFVRAEETLKALAKCENLTPVIDPLIYRLSSMCAIHPKRQALFLCLKLAALREKVAVTGNAEMAIRLETGGLAPWKEAEFVTLQIVMQRYLKLKDDIATCPLSDEEEQLVLEGVARRSEMVRANIPERLNYEWVQWHAKHYMMLPDLMQRLYELRKKHGGDVGVFEDLFRKSGYQGGFGIDWGLIGKEVTHASVKSLSNPMSPATSQGLLGLPAGALCPLPFETGEPIPLWDALKAFFGLDRQFELVSDPPPDTELKSADLTDEQLEKYFFEYYRIACDNPGSVSSEDSSSDSEPGRVESEPERFQFTGNTPLARFFRAIAANPEGLPSPDVMRTSFDTSIANVAPVLLNSSDELRWNPAEVDAVYLQANFVRYYELAINGTERKKVAKLFVQMPHYDAFTQFLAQVLVASSQEKSPDKLPYLVGVQSGVASYARGNREQLDEIFKLLKKKLTREAPSTNRVVKAWQVARGSLVPVAKNVSKGIGLRHVTKFAFTYVTNHCLGEKSFPLFPEAVSLAGEHVLGTAGGQFGQAIGASAGSSIGSLVPLIDCSTLGEFVGGMVGAATGATTQKLLTGVGSRAAQVIYDRWYRKAEKESDLNFDERVMIDELKDMDEAFQRDLQLIASGGKREKLEQCKAALHLRLESKKKLIISKMRAAEIPEDARKYKTRLAYVGVDEVSQHFFEGNFKTLQGRTLLNDEQMQDLVLHLLAFDRLKLYHRWAEGCIHQRGAIVVPTYPDDYWDRVTIDELRRHHSSLAT